MQEAQHEHFEYIFYINGKICPQNVACSDAMCCLYLYSGNFNKTCNTQYSHNLATEYYQVNLEKESQKILALLKPEKAALTELVQYYERH